MRLIRRTLDVPPSPIAEAHAWLAAREAAPGSGRALLDLSQAAPSHPPAPVVLEAVARAAAAPDGGRYTASYGLDPLRQAFAAEVSADYGAEVDPRRVLITAGCNQAFTVTMSSLAGPGDEVVLPIPYYFNHDMWLRLDGIRPVYLPCGPDGVPDPARADALVTARTRALVLVTPNNPTGAVYPPVVVAAFAAVARRHGIALVLDETYRTFRPGGGAPHGLLSEPGWDDTVVSLHSFSKDLAIPGHRVGAVIGHPDLLAEAVKGFDCVAICAPRPGQEAALAGLTGAREWRAAMVDRLGQRLRDFRRVMADRPGGFELEASGAFFGWVRHPFGSEPSRAVARRLLDQLDVLVIPGSAFLPGGEDHWLRFSFANLRAEELDELGRRLATIGP